MKDDQNNENTEIEKPQQTPEKNTTSLPIFDFLFGIMDRLFKDNATGKVLASRVLVLIVLFIMLLIWFKGDLFAKAYKESRYETYAKIIQQNKDQNFDTSALEQLQIAHVSSGADFSAVYSFRPRNLNYFVDLVAYEGRLPASVNEKNLGGFPVDKTSQEYQQHLSGASFETKDSFAFLPTKEKEKDIKYMYSCPYFNLDNVYSGSISLYWYNEPPTLEYTRLTAICDQAARALGRAR